MSLNGRIKQLENKVFDPLEPIPLGTTKLSFEDLPDAERVFLINALDLADKNLDFASFTLTERKLLEQAHFRLIMRAVDVFSTAILKMLLLNEDKAFDELFKLRLLHFVKEMAAMKKEMDELAKLPPSQEEEEDSSELVEVAPLRQSMSLVECLGLDKIERAMEKQ